MTKPQRDDYLCDNEEDEYLTRVVIDTNSRTFYMYSNVGSKREVACEETHQFMDVLELVRAVCDEDTIVYTEPLVAS
jgi:hypothetical protein